VSPTCSRRAATSPSTGGCATASSWRSGTRSSRSARITTRGSPRRPSGWLMAPLGRAALLLAFGLVAYALVAGSYAAWKRRRRLALSAQNALLAAFPVTLVAAIVLLLALGRRDLTFVYVS